MFFLLKNKFFVIFLAPFLLGAITVLGFSPYNLTIVNFFTFSILLFLTGLVTIFPLFFFNLGVKSIPLGFAGVIFFLVPTFQFLTAVIFLNEKIITSKIFSFIIIWIAVVLFIFDKLKRKKSLKQKNFNENNIQPLN